MNADVGLDFGAIDGLWVMLGMPIISVLIFVFLSPISFFIYRLLPKRNHEKVPPDADDELDP